MLKKFFLFLAAASMIVACSEEFDDSALRGEIDDLGGKVENLEGQVSALQQAVNSINAELATLQAIANGIAITKVEPVEGGFKITFSDGKSYTITNGQKGDKGDKGDQGEAGPAPTSPVMRIDSEGFWQVSYDGGTTWEYPNGEKISALGNKGEQGEQGAAGVTPQLGVDAEGYWTVSYDGGQTFARLKDANGNDIKAVASGDSSAVTDSNFASVKLSDDGSMLEIILAGETDPIYVPVGGKALVAIKAGDAAIEGVQKFNNGETKEYTIEANEQYMKLIGYPEGWTAVLAEKKLTVTAPAAAAAAASRATADTASDVSVLVVLENGMAVIARVQVAIAEPEPEPTPTPGDAKVFSIVAADLDAGALGLPTGTDACLATAPNGTAWTYNSVGLHSLLAISNATYAEVDGEKLKKPCLYFYKPSKMNEAITFIKNTTALGEIVSIKMTMLENNTTKAENFVVKETVNGTQQAVVSATATENIAEHVWNFTAGNDGMFEISNASTDDLKVVILEVTYKEAAAPAPTPGDALVWDAAVWGPYTATYPDPNQDVVNTDFDFGNGLKYISNGVRIRFAPEYIQPRATGDVTKGTLQLTVGGPGQLVIDISSNNDNGEKDIAIAVDGTEIARKTAHKATEVGRKVYTIDCSAAKADSKIDVYSTSGAYFLYVMKWIPGEGGSTPAPEPTPDPTPDPVALTTPVVSLDPASVEAGAEKAVAVAWAAVENAASYDVVFNGAAAVNVTTNAYTIDAATVKALTKGEYKVSVVAKPAADATAYLPSVAGEATLTVTEAAAPAPTPGAELVWGDEFFKNCFETISGGDKDLKIETDLDLGNGLKFIAGGGSVKFGAEHAHRIQLGGTGNFEMCTLELTVAGPGKLTVEIRSSNGSTDRHLGVWVNQVAKHTDPGYLAPMKNGNDPKIHEIDCSEAQAGQKINIHSLNSGINVYSIKWTPKQ